MTAREAAVHLRQLRNSRSAPRAQRLFLAYVVGLVSLWVLAPAVGAVGRLVDPSMPAFGDPAGAAAAAPLLVAGLYAGGTVVGLRFATWQGPMLVSAAAVAWYLTLPVDRAEALHPALLRGLLAMALAGLLLGAVVGLVVASATAGPPAPTVVAGAFGAAVLGLLTAACGLFIERGGRWARAVQWLSPAVVAAALTVLALGVAVFRSSVAVPGQAVLWSGPWGWAAQPAVHAATGAAPQWPLAAALLLVFAVCAVVLAWRAAPSVPDAVLRERAGTRSSFAAAMYLGEPRDARVATRAAVGRPVRPVRLPPPTRPWLVVAWRDLLHLRRAPAQVLAAAGYVTAAALLLVADTSPGWTAVGVCLAAHGAASRLLETARLDADDPRRLLIFGADAGRTAKEHAALATAALVLLGWLMLAAAAMTGAATGGQLLPVAAMVGLLGPVPVVAGLLSAYKGRPPLYLAVRGDDEGPLVLAGWYLVGPATTVVLLWPLLQMGLEGGVGAALVLAAAASAGSLTVGLRAVARRARNLPS